MSETPTYSMSDLRDCAKRELAQRRHVYPRRVEGRHMTQAMADRQTAMMEQILALLEGLAEKERLL